MVQFAGAADGHECHDLHTRQWVWHDAGVDERRLDAAIAAQRAHDAQSVITRDQLGERGDVSHDGNSFRVSPAMMRTGSVACGVHRSIRFHSLPGPPTNRVALSCSMTRHWKAGDGYRKVGKGRRVRPAGGAPMSVQSQIEVVRAAGDRLSDELARLTSEQWDLPGACGVWTVGRGRGTPDPMGRRVRRPDPARAGRRRPGDGRPASPPLRDPSSTVRRGGEGVSARARRRAARRLRPIAAGAPQSVRARQAERVEPPDAAPKRRPLGARAALTPSGRAEHPTAGNRPPGWASGHAARR